MTPQKTYVNITSSLTLRRADLKKNLFYLLGAKFISRLLFLGALFGIVLVLFVNNNRDSVLITPDLALGICLVLFAGSFFTSFIPWYALSARFHTIANTWDSVLKKTEYDTRSNAKEASIVPKEILGWSWGAYTFGELWRSYHRLPPFLKHNERPRGFYMPLYIFLHGREWAWRYNPYSSIDDFSAEQRSWDRWGIGLTILSALCVAGFSLIIYYLSIR